MILGRVRLPRSVHRVVVVRFGAFGAARVQVVADRDDALRFLARQLLQALQATRFDPADQVDDRLVRPQVHHGTRGGDAAHAMTLNLGQGASTAILDAEALTRAVSEHGPTTGLPSALRAYDAERRRGAQRIASASRSLHRFMATEHTRLRDLLVRSMPG
jgi:2-polyprenyl-6-methoxyphenol hydroxylase-like FAD-dependent oxidoreductase